jgi:hypothetical protein
MLRTSFGMQIPMCNFGAVDEYGTWITVGVSAVIINQTRVERKAEPGNLLVNLR